MQSHTTFADRVWGRSRYEYVRKQKAEDKDYPTGFLDNGNVEVHFLHYQSAADAKSKWEKRVKRINREQIFVKLSGDKDEFNDDDYRVFQTLPLKHKIAFSKEPFPDLPNVVCVSDWSRDGKIMYERSLRHFNIVDWLNAT